MQYQLEKNVTNLIMQKSDSSENMYAKKTFGKKAQNTLNLLFM